MSAPHDPFGMPTAPYQPDYRQPPPFAAPAYRTGPMGFAGPEYLPAAAQAPVPPPAEPLAFGYAAAVFAGVGALSVLVALVGLNWFSLDGGLAVNDIRGRLDGLGNLASGLSKDYFSWLSWVLLVVSTGSAVGAAVPRRGVSLAFRIVGPIVSGFAVLLTLAAAELTDSYYSDNSYDNYYGHLGAGFWTALAGFALLGMAAIIGPGRPRPPAGTSAVSLGAATPVK